jgi:hypothetical protein
MIEDHMRESLKNHVLELHTLWVNLTAYYLKPVGKTRMMSTLILFTVEGIVIMGDLTPSQNGVISAYGYGEGWFGSHKSPSYLCEKFLQKEFVPEYAIECYNRALAERVQEAIDAATEEGVEYAHRKAHSEAARWIKDYADELDAKSFYDQWWEVFGDTPDGAGYGYNPSDAGWLCAIQEKFAELFPLLEPSL